MNDDRERLAREDSLWSLLWTVLAVLLLGLSLLLGCSSRLKDFEFLATFMLVVGSASALIATLLNVSSRWWRHGFRDPSS